MSYLKDREIWLSSVPTGNPPAGYVWVFIQNGVFVVRDSNGVDKIMATTTGTVTNATSASYVEYSNVANKPALISGSSQVSYTGLSNTPAGIVSGSTQVSFNGITDKPALVSSSAQIVGYNVFATTGSNQFNGSQAVTGSLTVTGQVVAQTLNVQQVTSSIVYSSGSNIFGNSLGNTQQFTGSLQVTGSTHYLLGSVGVGIAVPTNPLHIASNTVSQLNIQALSGNTNAQINLEPTGTGIALIGPANNVDLAFRTNATERMRITSGSNVWIGNDTNPILEIANGGSTDVLSGIRWSVGSSRDNYAGIYSATSAAYNGYISFYTRSSISTISERMRITSGGNVGIGVTIPSGQLSIKNQISNGLTPISSYAATNGVDGQNFFNGYYAQNSDGLGSFPRYFDIVSTGSPDGSNGGSNIRFFTNPIANNSPATERMRITSGGNIGINNNNPGSKIDLNQQTSDWCIITRMTAASGFQVLGYLATISNQAPNNTSSYLFYGEDNIAVRFAVYSNGGIANYQANNVNLSDERTKKDIAPLESYWDKFKAIEIVKFKYKDQTHDDYNIGVIAQQVEAVAPEFVDIDGWDTKPKLDEEGNEIINEEEPLKSIYTADLHHATIKVLQEAMAKIESLEDILQRNNLL